MKRCGYIHLSFSDTNSQHIMKIISYPCASLDDAPYQTNLSVYLADKITFKILSKVTHAESQLPLCTLEDIVKTAVAFDKELKYPSLLNFSFDKFNNVTLHFDKYLKDVFPLPCKSSVYEEEQVYMNITECFVPQNHTSFLLSSILCSYLNSLALNSGIIEELIFTHSCGRIFMNTEYFLNTTSGRKFLKLNFSSIYELMIYKNLVPLFPKRLFAKEIENKKSYQNISDINNMANVHCRFVNHVCHKCTFYDFPKFADFILSLAREEIIALEPFLNSLFVNGALEKPSHADHLSIEDVLLSASDAHCRKNLKKTVSANRLFANAAKHRDIKLLFSGGEIVEVLYDII